MSVIEKEVAELICDVSPLQLSASHSVNASSRARSDGDKPLVVDQPQATLDAQVNASAATFASSGTDSSKAKSASSTHSMLLTNEQSVVITSDRTRIPLL